MKKQERYKLLNYAKNDYSNYFRCDFEFKKISKNDLYKLLYENKYARLCEWSYRCFDIYNCCFADVFDYSVFEMPKKSINQFIKSIIDSTSKICRKDNRILYNKDENDEHRVIIIARDVIGTDFLIAFLNK